MNFYIKRRERIILTAVEILDELGFQGLSTKEISKRQEISEGALYKHFKSKDEVIIGVLEFYLKYDDDIRQTIEMKEYSAKEGIRFAASRFGEYFQNYPAITSIPFYYETLSHEKNIYTKMEENFDSRRKYLIELIEKGIKQGEFQNDTDSESLADIILGTGRQIILRWRIKNRNFPLKESLLFTINTILKSY